MYFKDREQILQTLTERTGFMSSGVLVSKEYQHNPIERKKDYYKKQIIILKSSPVKVSLIQKEKRMSNNL